MPEVNIQNLKLFYLKNIFMEKTDENHFMSLKDLKKSLEEYNIKVTEQTLRSDIECLRYEQMDIVTVGAGKTTKYFLNEREFTMSEMKILCDCVQATRSIPDKKTIELIEKIEKYASIYERNNLHRQIYISGRAKTSNNQIWYNVDNVYRGITNDNPISFQYLQWNLKKQLECKYGGRLYKVSPWSLIYDGDCYYMVAFDHASNTIRHYRVDKMKQIKCIEDEKRKGITAFGEEDIANYSKRHFRMFGGEIRAIKLSCENNMINVILDRFGKEVPIEIIDGEHFEVKVIVAISDVFLGWLIGLGTGVTLVSPTEVLEKIKKRIKELEIQYK